MLHRPLSAGLILPIKTPPLSGDVEEVLTDEAAVAAPSGVALRVEVENHPGVLAQVAAAIAEADSNIDGVEYLERDVNVAVIRFSLEVKSRKHLADVIRRVRRTGVVSAVRRYPL